MTRISSGFETKEQYDGRPAATGRQVKPTAAAHMSCMPRPHCGPHIPSRLRDAVFEATAHTKASEQTRLMTCELIVGS